MKVSSKITPDGAMLAQLAIVRALARKAGVGTAAGFAEAYACPRVQRIIQKAPQGALNTDDHEALVDQQVVTSGFMDAIANESAFYRMFRSNMFVRASFRTRFAYTSLSASAWIVAEGKPTPISGLSLAAGSLIPETAVSIVVATNELLKSSRAEGALGRALRRAVSHVVDERFLALMLTDAPSVVSQTWTGSSDTVTDLRALLELADLTAESAPMFVMHPAAMRGAATMSTLDSAPAFPALNILDGSIWGIPAMPSSALDEGTVVLLDAAKIAADAGLIDVDTSNEASLEMLTTNLVQDSVVGTGTELVSLFQTNSSAIRARAEFGAHKLAANAAVYLTGVEWGGEVPAS